eukprot:COSAG02_NODE_1492_length_12334_cov_29.721945_11_plen_65_part_00
MRDLPVLAVPRAAPVAAAAPWAASEGAPAAAPSGRSAAKSLRELESVVVRHVACMLLLRYVVTR